MNKTKFKQCTVSNSNYNERAVITDHLIGEKLRNTYYGKKKNLLLAHRHKKTGEPLTYEGLKDILKNEVLVSEIKRRLQPFLKKIEKIEKEGRDQYEKIRAEILKELQD